MISKAIPRTFVWALSAAACYSSPAQRPAPNPLAFTAVADSVIHLALRQAQWGIEVWDQGRNQLLYAHNGDRHFIPASNTKLVVTTVAMGLLGPDWRYATPILVAGASGDSAQSIIIRGTGDPTMSARFFGSNTAVVDALADSLTRKGIRHVGEIVVDASAFSAPNIHSAWEIGDLPWYYATRTAAFAIAEAETRLIVSSGTTPASVTLRFPDASVPLPTATHVRIDTVGARANLDIDYLSWPDSLVVVGSMAPNAADTSRIALPEPELFAALAFADALKRKGIEVAGATRVARDSTSAGLSAAATVAFTWQSPPLHEIIAGILMPSQNWIAEQLLKTLGRTNGTGASWSQGLNVERRYLIDVVHIDSTAFSLSDGSGLSAQNVLAPHAFVMLLEHARRSPWGAQYRAALPRPGVRGATLSSRLPGLEDRLSAKTGTIANVSSLSGYLRTEDGRDLTFSILTNASGRSSGEMRRGMDAIVQALAREKSWD